MKRLGICAAICAAILVCSVFTHRFQAVAAQEVVRTIEIHAARYSFSPAEITLKQGETVKLVVISDDATHSLVVPDLHVNVPAKKGSPGEVTLTPEKVGDFKGRCGHFCGIGHASMTFVVHVKSSE